MAKKQKPAARTLDAMPDTVDFRDAMYSPSLVEVPRERDPETYRAAGIPVLDQGSEGACTGFGLATVANFLVRGRGRIATADDVSAWMFYAMAKRYDEWPGEEYSGSSARGAMKGWHKHGVCALRLWKDAAGAYDAPDIDPSQAEAKRSADAITRPLGAYFRVNHKDLVAMHAAIAEVGILYATGRVHEGWSEVAPGDGIIPYRPGLLGGHAFAIVGYDREGLWIQNSWGPSWGKGGLARIGYADWLENGTDVWVAALGVPMDLGAGTTAAGAMQAGAARSYETYVYSALRPHIVTSRNDGALDPKGAYGLTPEGLRSIVEDQIPARMQSWSAKRLMLHAHGGLVPQATAIQYIADNREAALAAEIYPLSFIWRSDAWSTLRNILTEAFRRRRDEGIIGSAKDFMLDRLDDTLEPVARTFGGRAMWDEMKENAERATTRAGGAARMTADLVAGQHKKGAIGEVHLVGHSAGAIFHAYLARHLVQQGVPIESLTLWAPACTMKLFEDVYRPLIESGDIRAFRLFTLDDATERDDDCAGIYHKSLLYLVSAAFEARPRIPLIRDGTPLLGLEKNAREIDGAFWSSGGGMRRWYVAPGKESRATHHGDFDNDPRTIASTFAAISGSRASSVQAVPDRSSAQGLVRRRLKIQAAMGGGGVPL